MVSILEGKRDDDVDMVDSAAGSRWWNFTFWRVSFRATTSGESV